MARAPARLKQIQLRLDETLSLSRGLENHLNPELPHAHESALTQLRRRDPTTTGTHDAQPLQPLDRSKRPRSRDVATSAMPRWVRIQSRIRRATGDLAAALPKRPIGRSCGCRGLVDTPAPRAPHPCGWDRSTT